MNKIIIFFICFLFGLVQGHAKIPLALSAFQDSLVTIVDVCDGDSVVWRETNAKGYTVYLQRHKGKMTRGPRKGQGVEEYMTQMTRYLDDEEATASARKAKGLIWDVLGKAKMDSLCSLTTIKSKAPLSAKIRINEKGRIDAVRLFIHGNSSHIRLISSEEVCLIIRKLETEVLFLSPTKYGIDSTFFAFALRREDVKQYLE